MFVMNVIDQAQVKWALSIVSVPEVDGTIRLCVEYWKPNAVTIWNSYSKPRLHDSIGSLGDATIFTALDARSGYWKLVVADKYRNKIAFASQHRLSRFAQMPFGLRNAPMTFQHTMDVIRSPVMLQSALVFLNDIFMFSSPPDEHVDHAGHVLTLLNDAGATLKLKKSKLFKNDIDYLGHVINPRLLWKSAHTQSMRFFAYRHSLKLMNYVLSLACVMYPGGSYQILQYCSTPQSPTTKGPTTNLDKFIRRGTWRIAYVTEQASPLVLTVPRWKGP